MFWREDGVGVLALGMGFLGPEGEAEFERAYRPLLTSGARLIVDLSALERLDSKRLATLVVFYKRVVSAGAQVGFCGLNILVRDTFVITRLDQVVRLFATRGEAVVALRAEPASR